MFKSQLRKLRALLAVPDEVKGNYMPRAEWAWLERLQDVPGELSEDQTRRLKDAHIRIFGRRWDSS